MTGVDVACVESETYADTVSPGCQERAGLQGLSPYKIRMKRVAHNDTVSESVAENECTVWKNQNRTTETRQ